MLWVFIIGTSIWVLVDAQQIGIKRGQLGGGFLDMTPGGWFFLCLLLCIVGFPLYLAKRPEYVRINQGIASLNNSRLKKCYFCAQEIKAEARVCRYCGREQTHKA